MLKAFVGWVLGLICGICLCIQYVLGDPIWMFFVIPIGTIGMALSFAEKHHQKKKKEYHDKLTGKDSW